LHCKKCGKTISEDANYCENCGTPKAGLSWKTALPTAGGVLTIASTTVCMWVGIIGVNAVVSRVGYYLGYPKVPLMIMGIFGFLAFGFGLIGGILALQRTHFAFAVLGAILALTSGIVDMIAFVPEVRVISELFGVPNIILSSLGLLFIALSKDEFTSRK